MKFSLIQSVVLFTFLLFSQMAVAQEKVIKGVVTDATSGELIPYATIALYDTGTTTIIQGTTTNMEGKFAMKMEIAEQGYIVVSFIGYEDQKFADLDFSKSVIDLGTIKLSQGAEVIDELQVTAERSTMEFKLDKRVFNVGKDIASSGQGALEVLNSVPSVNVDIEGTLTLRGNSGVQILIDGKPSVMGDDASSALGTITADMIEKIEVITNPSAKYEAGGTSGILNIVLKKDEKKGFNGSVSLNTGIPNNHSIGFSLNKRTEKLNLFTQIGAGYRSMPRYSEAINQSKLDNSLVESNGESLKNEQFYNVTLGSDFFLNDFNTITLSGNFAYEIESEPGETYFSIYDGAGELASQYTRFANTTANNPKYQFDLQYKKQFKNNEDHELLFSTVGSFFGKDQSSEFSNEYTYGIGNDYKQIMNTNFYRADYTFKLDYTNPLTKAITLETGAVYSINNVGNDYSVLDEVGTEWVTNDNYTNNFLYDQKVLGLYATGSYEKKKWGVKLGLRAENTDLTTQLTTTNENNYQNYTNLFPSAHTSYKFSDKFSMQAGYSKRIFRPQLWDLNPFFSIQNNYNIRAGNPDLLPEFGDSYEITSIFNFKKTSLNVGLYHLYTTDVIERVSYYENNVNVTTPINVGTRNKTGVEVNGKYTPTKWFSVNGDFNYGFFSRSGTFENQSFDFDSDQWSTKFTLQFKLPADIDVEIKPNYQSEFKTVQGSVSGFAFLDAGVRKKIWKGKAVVNMSVRDIFASRIRENIVDQADYYVYSFDKRGTFLTLGFSYSFGKGEAMTYSGGKRFR